MKLIIGLIIAIGLLAGPSRVTAVELECDEYKSKLQYSSLSEVGRNCTISFADINEEDKSSITVKSPIVQVYDNSRQYYYNNRYVDQDVSARISSVKIIDSSIFQIPSEIFVKFPNLITLTADNNAVQVITKQLMKDAKKLQEISLKYNKIKKLEKMIFYGNENLLRIDLYDNKVDTIANNAFSNLEKLQKLYLSSNQLKEITKEHLEDLKNLEVLDLRMNQLETLDDDLFENNRNLKSIHLTDNKLKTVGSAFDDLSFLEGLFLSNNLLEELDMQNCTSKVVTANNNKLRSLQLSAKTKLLSASNNKLTKIDFAEDTDMIYLNVSTNNLGSDIIPQIMGMTSMITLDLSFNQIGKINVTTFLKLEKLQILDLEATKISGIDFGTFTHQTKLTELDLSYNDLKELDLNMLSSLSSLASLFVDGNSLSDLEYKNIDTSFPNLRTLGISDNLWNCTFLSQMSTYLKSRNISVTPAVLIKNSTNIGGIACYNEKNPKLVISNPFKHGHVNVTGVDFGEMADKFDRIMEHLNKTTVDFVSKDEFFNKLNHLKHMILSEVNGLKEQVTQNKLSLLLANSNASSQFNHDIEILMRQLNNITLEKQVIANDKLALKISAVELKMESLSSNIDDMMAKMKILSNLKITNNDNYNDNKAEKQISIQSIPSSTDKTTEIVVILMFTLIICMGLFVLARDFLQNKRRYIFRRNGTQSETNTLREEIF